MVDDDDDGAPEDIEGPGPGDSTAPTARSFGEAEKLRRPSRDEIARAVEETPTLEDQRSPAIPVPSYLKKEDDSDRIVGTVGKGETPEAGSVAPGFTDTPSSDPTEKQPALSAPVLDARDKPEASKSGPPVLVFVAVALAAVAVGLALMLR